MSKELLVRSWKGEECGAEIESPVGSIELVDAELDLVAGGYRRRGSAYGGGSGNNGPGFCNNFSIVICNNTFTFTCLVFSLIVGNEG